jgi:leader peptidase (prepilin peptidase)/N-methyltransferase
VHIFTIVDVSLWVRTLAGTAVAVPAGWLAARLARAYGPAEAPPSPTFVVIAASVGLAAWAALTASPAWVLVASLGLGWTLLTLTLIDLATFRLPDAFTLPLAVAGLAVSFALPGRPILDHFFGAAMGYGLLAGIGAAYRRWRGAEGLGLGDAKLLAAGGGWLGWAALPSVLLIGCFAAFAWMAAARLWSGRFEATARIAFGPALALGIWIVWLHGPLQIPPT